MRNGTKAFVSIVSLGVVAAGYQVGLAAEVSNGFSATAPVIDQASAATPANTSAATPAATSPATPVDSVTATTAPATSPATPSNTTETTTPAPVSTPKATLPAPAPKPAPNTSGATKDGSAVQYRFGTVQVAVTKSAGKITGIEMLQAGATGGRQSAFTYLVDLAVQANGSGFGNLSGATYTTDAFKKSLESALAKF